MPKNKKRMILRQERNEAGLCAYCGLATKLPDSIGCADCGKKRASTQKKFSSERKDRTALYRRRTRKKVIDKYGGHCECCGETELLFLTIDHIVRGSGAQERKEKTGTAWYMALLDTPRRDDLRVLCYNCNMGREINGGVCPHHAPSPENLWETDLRNIRRYNIGCKFSWPSDDELYSQYIQNGVAKTAKLLGINADAIIRRLKTRGFKTRTQFLKQKKMELETVDDVNINSPTYQTLT